MGRRTRNCFALAALLVAVLGASACKPAARPTASTAPAAPAAPAAANQAVTPAADLRTPLTKETAAEAAQRLFPGVCETALALADNPEALRGARPGRPVAVSRDYAAGRPTIADWVLPNDARAVSGEMFAKMRPSAVTTSTALVPVLKNRSTISEFLMSRDESGDWQSAGDLVLPPPGGAIHDFEIASAKLRKTLGTNARIRPVVLLPSGLVFAVGHSSKGEAAVLLTMVGRGPGITGFALPAPEVGQLLSVSELRALLNTQPKANPLSGRNALGTID